MCDCDEGRQECHNEKPFRTVVTSSVALYGDVRPGRPVGHKERTVASNACDVGNKDTNKSLSHRGCGFSYFGGIFYYVEGVDNHHGEGEISNALCPIQPRLRSGLESTIIL